MCCTSFCICICLIPPSVRTCPTLFWEESVWPVFSFPSPFSLPPSSSFLHNTTKTVCKGWVKKVSQKDHESKMLEKILLSLFSLSKIRESPVRKPWRDIELLQGFKDTAETHIHPMDQSMHEQDISWSILVLPKVYSEKGQEILLSSITRAVSTSLGNTVSHTLTLAVKGKEGAAHSFLKGNKRVKRRSLFPFFLRLHLYLCFYVFSSGSGCSCLTSVHPLLSSSLLSLFSSRFFSLCLAFGL